MTSAKQFCRRKPNWELLDHRGITEDPSLKGGSRGWATGATGSRRSAWTASRSAGRGDGAAWLLSLASSIFIVSLFRCLLRVLSRRVEAFLHTAGFTRKRQHSNAASRTGRRRQTEFFIDQTFTSSDCDGCVEQKSASLRRRRSAGWRAPYRSLSAPLDRHTNYFVQQHTAEHRWSAGTLPVPSSQVKPPTVRLSTIKFIRKEEKIYFNSSVCTELFVFW